MMLESCCWWYNLLVWFGVAIPGYCGAGKEMDEYKPTKSHLEIDDEVSYILKPGYEFIGAYFSDSLTDLFASIASFTKCHNILGPESPSIDAKWDFWMCITVTIVYVLYLREDFLLSRVHFGSKHFRIKTQKCHVSREVQRTQNRKTGCTTQDVQRPATYSPTANDLMNHRARARYRNSMGTTRENEFICDVIAPQRSTALFIHTC